MLTILLIIIYIAFISLGLPDAILGSAWPLMHTDLNVPISYAGIATMIVSGGTIISSFFSEKMIRKFGTGKVTTISVLLTATGLLGIYFAPSFIWICLLGIPLGIGAGAVDAALNNFVALHYEAKHMNWLHCFWGIGATSGPFIMSLFLLNQNGWRIGYATIGIIQAILVICLFISLPLWRQFETTQKVEEEDDNGIKIKSLLKIPGAKPTLIAFFCYCAVELTTGLWASSYLVVNDGLAVELAAKWASFYYLGITVGRFIAGFLTMKLTNTQMIRIGQTICIIGAILLVLPITSVFKLIGLIFIGLGCAPIYPAMLHETPNRFGKELSQRLMGIQMATAYVGSTLIPPLFGALSKVLGLQMLPYFLLIFLIIMLVSSEKAAYKKTN
ncbi:MFS transporter [Turicibacter sanguinis]|uniref:MFS transporter n=2 Tax=Turicibacter sanguinis TaxID=154288 RepID=A0A9X4XFJ3_9FIRM|nr:MULTISPECIES: MFS transporter [Turicibacter]KAB6699931.1 MFS transporter [Phocaeicola vulgatus]EFF64323.1 transporter, major facilitator family protein [Turicibacter sanguinis PC909]MBP3904117.1 MFS transporter [Turicibacter sp.]MCU7191883.1 MFS transporter [Turicibacter sanguinis]MCU7198133.1 MFS transporter [Turicibacter sanguinis]